MAQQRGYPTAPQFGNEKAGASHLLRPTFWELRLEPENWRRDEWDMGSGANESVMDLVRKWVFYDL